MRHLRLVVAVLMFLGACGDDDAAPPEVKIDAAVTTPECVSDLDCEDGNDCNFDSCDEGVCKHVADAELEDTPCDDESACTTGDVCKSGTCTGTPMDCASIGDACNLGTCDEATGACVTAPKTDGTECDDGMFCTTGDSCQAGTCTGGTARVCEGGDACNVPVCDEATAACTTEPADNGTTCDDGLFCTTGDTCTDGTCGGSARDCAAAGDACNTGVCDEASGQCVKTPSNQGGTCDDGLFCTDGDTCNAGVCGGAARDCSAVGDVCNTGICSEGADACVKTPANAGATCDDGAFCTVNDKCNAGTCGGAARDCTAFGDTCNAGTCNETTNQCGKTPTNENGACNDGLFCSTGDRCVAGSCTPTGPRACGDTNTCTTDTCNEGTDVCDHVNTPVPGAEGPPGSPSCSDNIDNDCDGDTDGADASCAGCQNAGDCNDGNPCTADTCNAGTCVNAPSSGATCDDGLFCTTGDKCTAGVCGGAARDCSASGDACNNGACNESSDTCVKSPKPNNTACNDGLFCSVNDVCQNGTCGGAARDCSAVADACNTGSCNEGSDACVKTPANGGASCNDGLFCTTGDVCTNGTCGGAARDCSASGDACNNGSCNEGSDACVKAPKQNGTTCDTLFCATGETCQAGVCQGGTPVTCNDNDSCTTDTCNEAGDVCANNPKTVDAQSPVLSSSADGTPGTACLVANSGGKVLVWTELRDGAGQPIVGANVTIGGQAATASTSEPGTYYREVVAPAATGTTTLSVGVTACGSSVTLANTISLTTVAANAGAGGLGGCTPADGNLRVKVIAAETGLPIAGASVLVGQAEGTPFQKGPEGMFGGSGTPGSNVATTDMNGFATFLDYGTVLSAPFTVTGGAGMRAYMTVVSANASDIVLALPLTNPPPVEKAVYGGDGPATLDGNCDLFDGAFVLPQVKLDFFSTFEVKNLFERSRCWNSMNGIVNTVSIPGNLWIPQQSVGPFCLGGSIAKAPWTLSLPKGQTLNLETGQVTVPVTDVQAILSGGGSFTDLLSKITWRKLGWNLNEMVTADKTLNTSAASNHAMTITINYNAPPAEADVIGILAGDYSGGNGTGAMFLIGSGVHASGVAGTSVTVPNNPLTGSPAGTKRVVSLAQLYLDAEGHPNVPANRIKGISTALLRGDIGSGNVTLTASGLLGLAGTTVTQPGTFTWQNATANGNTPLYSVHELTIRETRYMPVLSCQTENDTVEAYQVQWIVVRPFAATCSGSECFTLPTLPASFPRAASSATKRSGFDPRAGSGATCTVGGNQCVAGETCVDPDGANTKAGLMCLTGSGTEGSPYTARDYFWKLHIYDLDVANFNFQKFNFADRITSQSHESSNGQSFQ